MIKKGKTVKIDSIVKKISKQTGQTEARTKKFMEIFFDEIGEGLSNEDRISLSGFGIFKKKYTEARTGYNPAKKKKMKIKAHNRALFSPSSSLANTVNRKYRHLKPNVIDEMKLITGLSRSAGQSALTPARKKARKRAKITLAALFVLVILFFVSVISIPSLFKESDAQAVQFVTELNEMMGLKSVSDKLAIPTINETLLGRYIFKTRQNLSLNRKIIKTHTVRQGDSIYSIANQYYGNKFLWPDLYYTNKSRFEDPDLLMIGDKIHVYEKLGDPKNLAPEKKRQLVQAYITMYRVSRALGEKEIATEKPGLMQKGKKRIEESRWTLYTALRYDHNLLDTYEDAIYPEDNDIVDDFIDRFGYGDGSKKSFWDIF
ncbi:MAG: HU family DNA-binding protein [Spirochaetia bacterium]|nr:HU family DNA-binding protein [Spirochaetia bacterium]